MESYRLRLLPTDDTHQPSSKSSEIERWLCTFSIGFLHFLIWTKTVHKSTGPTKGREKTESMPTKSTACHRTLRIFWWIETGSLKRAEKRFFKLREKQENATSPL